MLMQYPAFEGESYWPRDGRCGCDVVAAQVKEVECSKLNVYPTTSVVRGEVVAVCASSMKINKFKILHVR